ncbi:hypothetical protein V7056_14610 [Bacillus sp. JJ664]
MDLSFDKLLEQFDLKKNEHQRNMHKINKRIDEIESHMDSMKKQLHSFDHQIESIEKDLKTTLSMINQEEFSHSHQEQNNQNDDHQLKHNQTHKEKKNHHHKNQENHEEKHKWAESILNNVEEYASNIFKNGNEDEHRKNQTDDQNQQSRTSKNAKKRKNESELNPMPNIIPEQYSASISNHQTNTANIGIQNGAHSFDEGSLTQSYIQESFEQINQEHTLNQSTMNGNNNDQTIHKDLNQLEQNYEDLSIDDWEDKTTNLSMSEWFEVDPRTDR